MKDIPEVSDGDKILDVSLSLDNTPTMMRSRDTTPSKSLRFKEPRKIQSDLATEEKKQADEDKDDSQVSNETNDSFFSLGSQMDVDSPRVMPRDIGESPLVTKSFPDREQSPTKLRKPSGLANSSVSPLTKERLEKAMDAAEARLKQVTDQSSIEADNKVSSLEEYMSITCTTLT